MKNKALKVVGCVLTGVLLFLVIINILPPKHNVENNPFIVKKGSFR